MIPIFDDQTRRHPGRSYCAHLLAWYGRVKDERLCSNFIHRKNGSLFRPRNKCSRSGRPLRIRQASRRSLLTLGQDSRDGLPTRIEGSRHRRNGDLLSSRKARRELIRHGGVLIVCDGLDRGGGRVGTAATRLETSPRAVGVLAAPEDRTTRVGPDVEVLDVDVGARDGRGAVDLDRAPLHAVGGRAFPVVKGDVGVENTVAIGLGHAAPCRIQV